MTNAHQQIKEALKLLTKLEDEWQQFINGINPDAEMSYEVQTLLHTYRVANDKALALLETHTVTPNEELWFGIDDEPKDKSEILVKWPSGVVCRSLYSDGHFWFTTNRGKHLVNKLGYTAWRYQTALESEG